MEPTAAGRTSADGGRRRNAAARLASGLGAHAQHGEGEGAARIQAFNPWIPPHPPRLRRVPSLSRGSQRIFDPPDVVSTNRVCARGGRGSLRPSESWVYFTSDQSPCLTSTMWKASSVRPMWSVGLMVTVPPVPT